MSVRVAQELQTLAHGMVDLRKLSRGSDDLPPALPPNHDNNLPLLLPSTHTDGLLPVIPLTHDDVFTSSVGLFSSDDDLSPVLSPSRNHNPPLDVFRLQDISLKVFQQALHTILHQVVTTPHSPDVQIAGAPMVTKTLSM